MTSTRPRQVRIAGPALRDIERVLQRSQAEFGTQAKRRYRALLDQALQDLGADSTRPGVKQADDVRAGYFLYHLRYSRTATVQSVKKPRHIIAFYIDESDAVVIARVFHERQMLSRHLADGNES